MILRIFFFSLSAMLVMLAAAGLAALRKSDEDRTGKTRHVQGSVADAKGPIASARVRLQGTACTAQTDEKGRFRLPVQGQKSKRVTAWKTGYAIGAADVNSDPLRLLLMPLPEKDNDDYQWIDPAPDPNRANNCGNCHRQIFDEWNSSAHGQAATGRRFINLFAGTDWHGKPSPKWNLLKEHPLGSGVCANCHAPTFRDPTLEYDMRKVRGVTARGVHCDYCHKIADAPIDNLGLTFGKDGYELLRPADGEQLFFGPLDDAFREGEMFGYSPLYKNSQYCASCHEGTIFGVHVYGTYTEWLKSPAKTKGLHCQSCHMEPTGQMTNIAPGKGGIERDPKTLSSHQLPGATPDMLRRCLQLKIDPQPRLPKSSRLRKSEPRLPKSSRLRKSAESHVTIKIELTAQNVGHRVPTGFIDRHLLLVVEATDRTGKAAKLHQGPTLPPPAGKLSGKPGMLYAKLLHDPEGNAPIPFWLPHGKMTDNRLHPDRPDRQTFVFDADTATVRVRLIYRRFWEEVARSKHWPEDEIIVVDRTVKITAP